MLSFGKVECRLSEDAHGLEARRCDSHLFSNSAVTDQLYGGLGFVSGGSPEQALPGQLAITMDSVFVGSTAPAGAPDSSPLGPNLSTVSKCSGSFCTFNADGVPYFVGSFGGPGRLGELLGQRRDLRATLREWSRAFRSVASRATSASRDPAAANRWRRCLPVTKGSSPWSTESAETVVPKDQNY